MGNGNPSHLEWFPLPSFLHPVLYGLTILQSSHAVKLSVFNTMSAIKLGHKDLCVMLKKLRIYSPKKKKKKQAIKLKMLQWMSFLGIYIYKLTYINVFRKTNKCGDDIIYILMSKCNNYKKKKHSMRRKPYVKKSEDDYMTAASCSLMEYYNHRQHRRNTLFTCLCPRSLFTHLCKIFLKRIACLLNHQFERAASSYSISPGIFVPLQHYLSMPPPINPSLSLRLLCANLYSLSHATHLSCPY